MELSSTLQLERMSLGEAEGLSPPSSPTPLSSDSSHAPALTSLPPELLNDIIETLFDHYPVRKRKADLASLCLVNKTLRIIAQPLLFRAFSLNFAEHESFSECVLYSELDRGEGLAGMVKELKLESLETVLSDESSLDLAVILDGLSQLHTIRVGWSCRYSEAPPSNIELLVVICPRIRHLELPDVRVGLVDLGNIAVSLPHLETFIADLPQLDTPSSLSALSPAFHLRRFAATSLPDPALLLPLLRGSETSLHSLSLRLESADPPPSLSSFVNLRSLAFTAIDPSTPDTDLQNMQVLLLSVRHLPIQRVAIAWSDRLDNELNDIDNTILQVLPLSIRSLTFGLYKHSSINWLSLISTSTSGARPYPLLEHLSIFPLCPQYSDSRMPVQLSSNERELVRGGEECGMEIEWIKEDQDNLYRFATFILDPSRVLSGDYAEDIERQIDSEENSDYGQDDTYGVCDDSTDFDYGW